MTATTQQIVVNPKRDAELNIAVGQSRTEMHWHNQQLGWSALLDRLNKPTITQETHQEFMAWGKAKRDERKDVGGFVGGWLKQGRRKAENVQSRALVTLDADFPDHNLWDDVELIFPYAVAMYSTHSYSSRKQRVRLIIPLKRIVTPDEYEPIARKLAERFGMNNFDDTTYQAERLMYWPSHSIDGDYFFKYQDDAWVDPDEVLAEYEDWTDSSFWPMSDRVNEVHKREAKRQGDPLTKKGVIGAFNRTYDIRSVIEKYLADVYAPTEHDDRYTYIPGSTSGGLVLYDDKFAYSHHSTDPVGDQLCNAFDLVRLHKFGDLDDEAKPGTPVTRLPSYKAMREFAMDDSDVTAMMAKDRIAEADDDFADPVKDDEWVKQLEMDENGAIDASAKNLETIMRNDANLKDCFYTDQFASRLVIRRDVPWRKIGHEPWWKDSDDAGLRVYLEKTYGIVNKSKIDDAFIQEAERNAVHPVREYLNGLNWDGKPRLETMLMDYLGAEDTKYNRIVTKKFMAAAVARVMHPGIKFDFMLVTSGPQGIGKTSLPQRLAGKWFSNSLENVTGKDAYESLQGAWIIEMGEMTATKKADIEATKHFISKTEDNFRVAYGRHKSYFPRQCVFWGTSNDSEFLRDRTGNRRFWPVDVGLEPIQHRVWDMRDETRDQLWAEALADYEMGEQLYLSQNEEKLAVEQQKLHTEVNALEGMIAEYVNIPITEDWYKRSAAERRVYIANVSENETAELGSVTREKVSVAEVWNELLKGDPKNLIPVKATEIRNILENMDGWQKHRSDKGQLRFGTDYGKQVAYVRES